VAGRDTYRYSVARSLGEHALSPPVRPPVGPWSSASTPRCDDTLIVAAVGVVIVYSRRAPSFCSEGVSPHYYLNRQAAFVNRGHSRMDGVWRRLFDYRWLEHASAGALLPWDRSSPALACSRLGSPLSSTRWIQVGPSSRSNPPRSPPPFHRDGGPPLRPAPEGLNGRDLVKVLPWRRPFSSW